jgi:proline racemase
MVQAIDAHACGEPGRVIVGGVLDVPGATMYDKMCYLRDQRTACARMLTEPRALRRPIAI